MNERERKKLALAKEHFERREFDHAEPLLLQIIETSKNFADVFNMLGIARHDRGDFIGARAALEEAIRVNPNYTEARLNLVVVCNDLGDYEAARKVFEAIEISRGETPGSRRGVDPYALGKIANMHLDVAQAYIDAGYAAEAIEEVRRAVVLRPGFADLHVRLGVMLREAGQVNEALAALNEALTLNPRLVSARLQLGVTQFSSGNWAAAKAEFLHAQSLDGGEKTSKMYLRLLASREAAA